MVRNAFGKPACIVPLLHIRAFGLSPALGGNSRKANTVGATLFSFIIPQHDQILRWLETQPFVDGKRIAFYGLCYGGESAIRIPAILEKYCLSICSGDFNRWTRKVAVTDQPFSFMRTVEWEMPCWNLGRTFDCAEMACLIVPRPFMVERGHPDRVGRARIREGSMALRETWPLGSHADRIFPRRPQHQRRGHI